MTLRPQTGIETERYGGKDNFTPSGFGPGLRLGSRSARILVIDETFSNNGMLERRLEALGANVTHGRGAPPAATVRSHNPDLILLGAIPEAGRSGILQDLAKDPRTQAIPIFVLGASDDTAQRIESWKQARRTTSPSRSASRN